MMEALETRQLLSTTVPPPSHGPPPVVPPVVVPALPAVQSIGVTIHAIAGESFTAVVGKVTGLDKSLLANLKGLQAIITWNDYAGDDATSKGVLSVSDDTLIVTGTHTYQIEGTHNITVNVLTVPPVVASTATTVEPLLLATIHSTADVSLRPIGVTFGIASAGTSFTGVVGKVQGFDKATLKDLGALQVTINWGDDTAPSAGTLSAASSGLVSVTGTHTYAIDGQYNVTITIKTTPSTPANAAAAAVTLAVIHSTADVAFVQPIGVTFGAEANEPFSGVVGQVKGLDHTTLGDLAGLQAVITWGDGSATSHGTLSVSNTGVLLVNGSHTYTHSGKYAVTIVVETIPPVLNPPAATTAAPLVLATINSYASVAPNTEGGVHLDEIASEPFTAIVGTYYFKNDGLVQSAVINWGDGTSSKGTILAVGPNVANWAVKGSHTYAKVGNYKVQTTVTATPAPIGGVSNPIILLVADIKSTITVLG